MVHVFNRQHAFSIGGALSLFIFTSLVSNAVAAAARRRTTENDTYFENAVALNPVGGSGSDLRPINVITLEKEPLVSGSRVEPMGDEVRESPFLGYTKKGMSLVQPHSPFMYVLFGFWLDEVTEIAFTVSNCSFPDYSIFQKDFVLQTDKRIIVHTMFEEHHLPLRLCLKQKVRDTTEEAVFEEIMEPRTMISTEYPQRTYYFNFYLQICIISCFLVLSGLFSGLNLGLMALTPQELMLIEKSGSDTERRYAETILPVRKKGNLLLCSLLIGNVCVNSAISILFDDLTSGYVALIVSSAGIVIFGEIFPQSVCVKKGLAVGARTILITKLFIVLTFPLAWPISWILDRILGDEVASYDRKRLMELIKMNAHREGAADELKIAVGAMEISDKVVRQIMTKIDDVFMLPDTTVLNTKTVAEILHMGYTRIPVFEAGDRNRVVSLLFVKDLALIDPDDNFTVQTVCGYHKHPLRFVMEDTPLRMMLEEFKKGDYHLAMVQTIVNSEDKDPSYELVGIVTLEDIVEEILQAEIVDETDAVTDNVHRTRRRGAQARDLSYLVNSAEPSRVISVQMQLMTMQWLTTNHRAFCQEMIGQNVLEKLIRQHVRRVELTHLPEMYDSKTVVPRNAKIFTKDEFTDKFVLILEGRALVTIGQDQMTFEAGPWQAFGTELLERIADQCTNGEKSITQSRGSLQLGDVDDPKKKNRIGFMPDFSVIVRDDCTFLEITATTYLLAYKTTCISRGQTRPSIGDGASPMDRSPELNKRAPSQTSLFSSVLQRTPSFQNVQNELANRLIRNGSNGKTRSCSESEKVELIPKIDFLSPRDMSLFSEESTRTIS